MADLGINGGGFANTGIWKTSNGGTTWTNLTTSITSRHPWSAVVVDPSNSQNIYAACGYYVGRDKEGFSFNGVCKSTDGGATWNLLSNGPNGSGVGRIAIAVSTLNSQVVYVTAAQPYSPSSGSPLYKIMRSDDGGSTFTDLTSGTKNYMGKQGEYDTTIAVDPSNSAIVYVGGESDCNSMLRSTDSGQNWSDVSNVNNPNLIFGCPGSGTAPHVDHHAAVFDANGLLLDGDDGGIYRLDNPATTPHSWSDLNGNLNTIQFQGIGLHPTNANTVIGGSQDNGTELYTGNAV